MRKMTVVICIMTLLVGLGACTSATERIRPTAPTLEPVDFEDRTVCFAENDRMTCFDPANAEALGVYIIELERCCER